MELPARLRTLLDDAIVADGPWVVLTGAGVSAESGVPTFRGPEGYWQVGSRHYRPQELATLEAFRAMPAEVWGWYLHRRAVCRAAEPNGAHRALAALERQVGDRMVLITQNVDGLHLRAGSTPERTWQIHGNLDFVRCAGECDGRIRPFPEGVTTTLDEERRLNDAAAERLRCGCGAWLRPHVLWFDECYDEARYRFESALAAAERATLLLIVGTSGATNLPAQVCRRVFERGEPMVVVNRDASPFTALAERSRHGFVALGAATEWVPEIAAVLGAR